MSHLADTKKTHPATESDPVLADLFRVPYRIACPEPPTAPFVFAAPHAGRLYPGSFVAESLLAPLDLRRSEDAYTDKLFECAVGFGASLIAARFPRAFVDANRAPGELDPTMFDPALDMDTDPKSSRVAAGLGVIPRIVREGAEIYRGKLVPSDAEIRLRRLHKPYHEALAELVAKTHARFGLAIVVDCHSMPGAAHLADIVLGDRHGASASPDVMALAQSAFEACGFSVARNFPYAGGYTTALYAKQDEGIHAIQIEVNRAIYLDEDRIARGAHFDIVRARLGEALKRFMTGGALALAIKPQRLAAE